MAIDPLGTYTHRFQPNNLGGVNISVGSTAAKALNGQQRGGILPQIVNLYVVPAATDTANIAAAQTLGGAGYLTLTAGAGVQAVPGLVNYITTTTDTVYYFLDATGNSIVPRVPTVTLAGGGNPSDVTIWGFDQDNVFMTDQVTSIAGSTVNFHKSFAGITRVWTSDTTGGQNISIGGGNLIGLNYVCNDVTKIISSVYGASGSSSQATIEQGSGTLVAGQATVSATTAQSNSVILINRTDPNGSTAGTPTSGTAALVAGTVNIPTTAVQAGGIITLTNTGLNSSAAGTPTSGTATLTAGVVTVTTTAVQAGSVITLTRYGINGSTALGELTVPTITPGVSFDINSLTAADAVTIVAADTSIIGWSIIEPQIGSLTVSAITPSVSFDVTSVNPVSGAVVTTDVSSVGWSLIAPQIGSLTAHDITPGVNFLVSSIDPVSGGLVATDISKFSWQIATVASSSSGSTPADVTVADLTYPATITSGDIRGYVSMIADGSTVVSVVYMVGGTLLEVNSQTYTTLYGVPQFYTLYN